MKRNSAKEHLEKRGWADAMRAKAVTKEAKLEKAAIDNEIVQKATELSELDEKLEQENKSLRASTAMKKVKEAESIIDKKDKIISDAKDEADEIIAAGKKEVLSIRGKSQFIKENEELKSQLDIYDSVMERNPEFARAVEQEERKRKLFKVKGKKQEMAL